MSIVDCDTTSSMAREGQGEVSDRIRKRVVVNEMERL
jgi:hypothetical protein